MAIDPRLIAPPISSPAGVAERVNDLVRRVGRLEAVRSAIGAGTITGAQISATPGSMISTANIEAGAITSALITAGAINAGHIQAGSIGTTQLAAGAVTAGTIAAGTITAAQIAAGTITANEIAAATITASRIATGTLTATQIATATITANELAANSVTATQIASNAVTALKISVSNLAAISTDMGSISAGTITGGTIQSGTSGSRWVGDGTGLRGYASDGITKTFELNTGSGVLTVNGVVTAQPGSSIPVSTVSGSFGGGNRVSNSNFSNPVALASWSQRSSNNATKTIVSTPVVWGNTAHKLTRDTDGGGPDTTYIYQDVTGLPEGVPIVASAYFRPETVARTTNVRIDYFDGSMATVGTPDSFSVTEAGVGQWTRTVLKMPATPTGAVTVRVRLTVTGVAEGESHFIGGVQVETGDAASAYAPRADEILPDSITAVELAPLAVTAAEIAANTITAGQVAAGAIGTTQLANLAVDTTKIANAAVTATQIGAAAVGTTQLANLAVDTTKIANAAVTATQIGTAAVGNTQLANLAVDTSKLGALAVDSTKLAAGSVVAGKVAALAVTAGTIAANVVTATEIASNAVTAGKINAGAVTAGTVAAGVITATELGALAVTAGKINAGAVTATEIAANAVTAGKINTGAVTAGTVAAGVITATELGALAVTAGKVAANAITATEIASNAVTAGKINAGAVTAGTIAALAVTAGTVAAGVITATELAALAVTAGKVAANAITATEIAAGAITTAKMTANTIDGSVITAGTLAAAKITSASITATQIAAGAITASTIAAGAIQAQHLSISSPNPVGVVNGSFRDPVVANVAPGWSNSANPVPTNVADATFGSVLQISPAGAAYVYQDIALPIGRHVWRVWAKVVAQTSGVLTTDAIVQTATATIVNPANLSVADIGVWKLQEASIDVTVAGTVRLRQRVTGVLTAQFANSHLLSSVTTTEVAPGAITTGTMTANSIAGSVITAGTLDASKITAVSITAAQLAAGTITSDKIAFRYAGTNFAKNSSFEQGIGNVTATNATAAIGAFPRTGANAIVVTTTTAGAVAVHNIVAADLISPPSGSSVTMTAYVKAPSAARVAAIVPVFFNAANTGVGGTVSGTAPTVQTVTQTTNTGYQRVQLTFPFIPGSNGVPATAAKIGWEIQFAAAALSEVFHVDDVQVELGDTPSDWSQYIDPTVIDGATITAPVIRTGVADPKLQLDATNGLFLTDASANIVAQFKAGGGGLDISSYGTTATQPDARKIRFLTSAVSKGELYMNTFTPNLPVNQLTLKSFADSSASAAGQIKLTATDPSAATNDEAAITLSHIIGTPNSNSIGARAGTGANDGVQIIGGGGLSSFLQMGAGPSFTRIVWGTSTVVFTASQNSASLPVTHGLGTTPSIVVATCHSANIIPFANTYAGTTFALAATNKDTATISGSFSIDWIAIG